MCVGEVGDGDPRVHVGSRKRRLWVRLLEGPGEIPHRGSYIPREGAPTGLWGAVHVPWLRRGGWHATFLATCSRDLCYCCVCLAKTAGGTTCQ